MQAYLRAIAAVVITIAGDSLYNTAAGQACPTSCLYGLYPSMHCSTAAEDSAFFLAACPNPYPVNGGFARYDARHGTIHVEGFVIGNCTEGYGAAGAIVADRFEITGPGTGPVTLNAVFDATIYGDSGGMNLQEGLGDPTWVPLYGDTNHTVTLPLSHVVGGEFVLQYGLYAYGSWFGNGHATVDGTLSFTGLDPAYRITSCQHFGDETVGIARARWGDVKRLYE